LSYLLVFSTAPSRKEARRLADLLLEKRLAACVSLSSPVESFYRWKGKKERAKEIQLCIKTRATLYKKLEKTLKKYHSYAIPEILALPIRKGNRDYLSWIDRETTPVF